MKTASVEIISLSRQGCVTDTRAGAHMSLMSTAQHKPELLFTPIKSGSDRLFVIKSFSTLHHTKSALLSSVIIVFRYWRRC